jgi:hypothetical protein
VTPRNRPPEKPKPCPWCGVAGKAMCWYINPRGYVTGCTDLRCPVQPTTTRNRTRKGSIAVWNYRPKGKR